MCPDVCKQLICFDFFRKYLLQSVTCIMYFSIVDVGGYKTERGGTGYVYYDFTVTESFIDKLNDHLNLGVAYTCITTKP